MTILEKAIRDEVQTLLGLTKINWDGGLFTAQFVEQVANHFKREGAREVFEWGDGMCLHTGIAGDGAVFRKNCVRCRQEFQKELEDK